MNAQDELDLDIPELGLTETDILHALYARYGAIHGNGRRYACAAQVRSSAGFDARRTADFVAMDLWPSARLTIHGHEIKVSRSDWLREIKKPAKAAEFIPYVNCWWLVVSDARIVRPGELPDEWGLMAMRGPSLVVVRKAPRRDALPMKPSRLAALLRAVAQTSEYMERRRWERRQPEPEPRAAGFTPEQMSRAVVMCTCTQIPELGPCEHQRAAGTGGSAA